MTLHTVPPTTDPPTNGPPNRLAALLDADVPLIAMSFVDVDPASRAHDAAAQGLDVAELRIDRFESHDHDHVLDCVRAFTGLPTIATIRTVDEGGAWDGSEADRLALFRVVLPEVDAIDVELRSSAILDDLVAEAHSLGKLVVISHHDFDHTPSGAELGELAGQATSLGADLVKVAATAHSTEELRTLARFTLDHASVGLVVIAMGRHGVASRILFPLLGSKLTFARSDTLQSAPGQLPFGETFDLLRTFSPEFDATKSAAPGIPDGIVDEER